MDSDKASKEIVQSLKEWHEASDAIAFQTSARRKSEAVRNVLFKMNLIFTPTGRKRPTSVLTDWGSCQWGYTKRRLVHDSHSIRFSLAHNH